MLPPRLGPLPVSDRGMGATEPDADRELGVTPATEAAPMPPKLAVDPKSTFPPPAEGEEKSTSSLSPTMSRPFLCLPRTTSRRCRLPAPEPADARAAAMALLALAALVFRRHAPPPPPPPRVAELPVLVLLEVESRRRSSCPPLVPAVREAGRLLLNPALLE